MKVNYFHLSPCENTEQIMKEGLRADEEGNIFVFTDMLVANAIAKNQVFTLRYSVFKIDRNGIKNRPVKDNVAEFEAPFHRIIKQNRIGPEFLILVCEQDTIRDRPTEWDYLVNGRFSKLTREQTDKKFEILRWSAQATKRADLSDDEILKEVNRRFAEL